MNNFEVPDSVVCGLENHGAMVSAYNSFCPWLYFWLEDATKWGLYFESYLVLTYVSSLNDEIYHLAMDWYPIEAFWHSYSDRESC